MTTDERLLTSSPGKQPTSSPHTRRPGRLLWIALLGVAVAFGAWVLSFAQTGTHEDRITNPNAPNDPTPEQAREWAGLNVHDVWVPIFYGITFAAMIAMIAAFVRHRRRFGTHHLGLPIFLAFYSQLLVDPFYNWAMYAPYDPELLHWPTHWPIVNIDPSIEPLWVVMGAYQVFYLGPALLFFWMFKRFVAPWAATSATALGSWITRHQKGAIFGFACGLGMVADVIMEMWMLDMGIYRYTQIAGPYISWSGAHLGVFEIVWTGLLIAVCAVLLHRDDRGRSLAQVWATGVTWFRRIRVGQFGVVFMVVVLALALYGVFWAALRVTGQATNVIGDEWPYPSTKVYDPDGRLKDAGFEGPYFDGGLCIFTKCENGN